MKFIKKHYLWIIVGLIIIGGSYYWYNKSKATPVVLQYKTTAVTKGTLISSISGSGNVIVDQSATVDPTITGTVTNLAVNIGDSVKKGQTLFTIVNDQLGIDANQTKLSYIQAQSSLESAKASKKQASYDLDHNSSGSATKNILKNKLEAAKISLTSAEENVPLAQAKYQNALTDAAKRTVTAPISGTVNAINIKNGDDLSRLSSNSNSSAPIIIGDLNTLKAQVQVNEVDISNVSIGQKATMTFNGIEGLSLTGKVEKMDSLGTLTSGVVTYNVTIGFDSLDERIKPAMSVSASIITDAKQDVLLVPNSAVKTQNGSSYVQFLTNGTPEQIPIEIGLSNNTDTQIISGIKAGDNVITQTIKSGATSTTSGSGGSSLRVPGLGGGGFRGD
ncbi:MAG: efflux RND transporter periplasmic adaptor subunit [Parcubacteria group bacterium]|jgi:RND family efflux transporter MFP subunit